MGTARVFRSGNSQAVRLPERVSGEERGSGNLSPRQGDCAARKRRFDGPRLGSSQACLTISNFRGAAKIARKGAKGFRDTLIKCSMNHRGHREAQGNTDP